MSQDNLLSIIEEGQYRSALFTTFTLNVGFFEGYVLPRLHRAHCNDITILVDERFYAESLGESSSRHVGIAYRLLPVKMVNGIFHAKLSYLWGASETDTLTVGSGNLTIAGLGRQLECIHVLRSNEQSQAFRDMAEILNDLMHSNQVRLGDAVEVIEKFQKRAAAIKLANSSNKNEVRLLNSLNEPISTSLIKMLGKLGPIHEMVAMSPFHDSKARPLKRLAKGLGAEVIKVAIDHSDRTPLDAGLSDVKFVRRVPVVDTRSFHAKWYEFRANDSWLLSGSVNATHTSLETTNNFEVATLQQVGADSLCQWKSANPNITSVVEDENAGDLEFLVITASVKSDTLIEGAFFSDGKVDGKWHAVVNINGSLFPIGILLVQERKFAMHGPSELAGTTEPCQIELTRSETRAVGWVMFPAILGMSWEQRDFARRVRKLRGPSGDQDDFISIVSWLAEKIWQINAISSPKSATAAVGQVEDSTSSNLPFDYGRWQAGNSVHAPDGSALGMCRMALAALAQFKKSKLKNPSQVYEEVTDFTQGEGDESDKRFQEINTDEEDTDSLSKLGRNLEEILNGDSIGPEDGAFFLEALLWMTLLRNIRDRKVQLDALPFVQWGAFARPLLAKYPEDLSIACLSATAMCCAITFRVQGDPSADKCLELGNRAICTLGETFSKQMVLELLQASPAFSPLSEEQQHRVPNALDELRGYASLGLRLHQYLADWSNSSHKPQVPPELADKLGDLLSELNKRKHMQTPYTEWGSRLPSACDNKHCRVSLATDASELSNRRGIACRGCKKLHFWTGDQ